MQFLLLTLFIVCHAILDCLSSTESLILSIWFCMYSVCSFRYMFPNSFCAFFSFRAFALVAKNYWSITLTSIAAKIYNALLRNHIEPKIDNILRKNQNGFQKNRSTTSQILTICGILEGIWAKNLLATILFVDFTKAFDSIHRGKMEQILLSAFSGWRHRLLWHCSWGTARRHTCPIPLYHLSRLCA